MLPFFFLCFIKFGCYTSKTRPESQVSHNSNNSSGARASSVGLRGYPSEYPSLYPSFMYGFLLIDPPLGAVGPRSYHPLRARRSFFYTRPSNVTGFVCEVDGLGIGPIYLKFCIGVGSPRRRDGWYIVFFEKNHGHNVRRSSTIPKLVAVYVS